MPTAHTTGQGEIPAALHINVQQGTSEAQAPTQGRPSSLLGGTNLLMPTITQREERQK